MVGDSDSTVWNNSRHFRHNKSLENLVQIHKFNVLVLYDLYLLKYVTISSKSLSYESYQMVGGSDSTV